GLVRTYTELFRVPEFTALFVASSAQVAASTVTGLALATLVYSSTGSPLLSALVMFGPSLAQVAGASLLLSAADQIPPRATLTWLALIFAVGSFAEALPGVGVAAILAIGLALGVVSSLGSGVRYGLMNEIAPPGGYMLGQSVLNMSVGIMQIIGFAAGGVLVTVMSPRETLVVGAVLYLVSGVLAFSGLSRRAAPAHGGAPGPRRGGEKTSSSCPRPPAVTSTSGCACRTG